MAADVVQEEKDEDQNKQTNAQIETKEDDENTTTADKTSETVTENDNSTSEEKNDNPDAAGVAEERFRVDRKKLESLLLDDNSSEASGSQFFHRIEQATNTTISWPLKLKIGAKSKKDPYIKVAGLPEDRHAAKQMVLSVMDTKSTRVTLKMDVSFTDHSHIIGKGGKPIKRVMESTKCHIHFPDSNRTSSEKSNQVSIAGPPFCVESARRQIRELLPIVLKFEIPSQSTVTVPDSNSAVIARIAQTYSVTISFQQRLAYGYIGCVKGLHANPFAVRDAVLKIFEHLTGTVPVTVHVTTQMEVDPKHHLFILGRNGVNIKKITQSTGASVNFPDPNDSNARRSTVTITGTIEAAVTAKVYLLQFLPLILMFDIRDGENEEMLAHGVLNQMADNLDVQITVKPKPKQFCKEKGTSQDFDIENQSIIVKGYEKNAPNIYKARLSLIGEDPANMPYLTSQLATLVIPSQAAQLHLLNGGAANQSDSLNNLVKQSGSPLSPPVQSSSPLQNERNVVSPVQQRIIGSEVKMMKRLSLDGLFGNKEEQEAFIQAKDPTNAKNTSDGLSNSRSAESLLEVMKASKNPTDVTKEIESLALSGSWSRGHSKSAMKPNRSNASIDSGLSRSQEDLNNSATLSLTANLLNKLAMQGNPNFNPEDYEMRKKMALNAMHSQVQYGKVRTPTDAWSGLGFSNSMPEKVIKELWQNREKRNKQNVRINQSNLQPSPTTSLDSSASSNGSTTSHGMGHQSPTNKPVRPPPGLEDSHPSLENSLLLNNNYDYKSMLMPQDQLAASPFSKINTISDLLKYLNLEQYTEAFEKEEVDLSTFVSLTHDDLKELGVATLGARKKMENAMRDLVAYQSQQVFGATASTTTGVPSPLMTPSPYYPNRAAPAFDIAAHSLRW